MQTKKKTDPTLTDLRLIILQEDPKIKKELQDADKHLKQELAKSSEGSERRLEILFYSIMVRLRLFSIETPEMARLFREFLKEMDRQITNITHESVKEAHVFEEIGKKGFFRTIGFHFREINRRLKILEDKIRINQMRAFLYICEHYVHILEGYYKNIGMSDRVIELYISRMNIKKNRYFFDRKFWLYLGFSMFRIISNYGTSFLRLTITCSTSIAFFAMIYWFADFLAPEGVRMIAHLTDYSSYFFNSLVTITGLGIDASPQTALQRVAMGINAIYGMIVFGMLFNVISTKLSMNN